MGTKIYSQPANDGNSTNPTLPSNTEVTISAVTNSSKTQGIFFQWEFSPNPGNYGYTGSGENNTVLMPATKISVPDQSDPMIQIWFWSVDSDGTVQASSVKQTTNEAGKIVYSAEDATDGDYNDTVLTISWSA